MAKYLRHYRLMTENLDRLAGPELRLKIMPEAAAITDTASPRKKVRWAVDLMERMESGLSPGTAVAVRRECRCPVPAWQSETIARLRLAHPDQEDFLQALSKARFAGQLIRLNGQAAGRRTLSVSYGARPCVCPVIRHVRMTISRLFCECCAGYMQDLYALVFDGPVAVTVVETVSSGGAVCAFEVRY